MVKLDNHHSCSNFHCIVCTLVTCMYPGPSSKPTLVTWTNFHCSVWIVCFKTDYKFKGMCFQVDQPPLDATKQIKATWCGAPHTNMCQMVALLRYKWSEETQLFVMPVLQHTGHQVSKITQYHSSPKKSSHSSIDTSQMFVCWNMQLNHLHKFKFFESLMYTKNKEGPRNDPWGTPALISCGVKEWRPRTTDGSVVEAYYLDGVYR